MGRAEIELGGKSRRLRFDFNAMADIEQKAGLGIGAMFDDSRIGFNSIRLLVWGGLKWQEHGLTIDRTGMMLNDYLRDGGKLEDIMDVVRIALQQGGLMDFGEVDEEGEGNMDAETATEKG